MINKLMSAVLTAVVAIGMVGVALPNTVSADTHDNPGNNGTVKVDGLDFDSAPDNQPKVGCTFQVDFYGYGKDVGDAEVTFELQAPTNTDQTLTVKSGDLTPNIGEDEPGGGTDVDAQETYNLAFTGEPSAQGYHVKLTINAPDSIGAAVKHKVFYVSGCEPVTEPVVPSSALSLVCVLNKYTLTVSNTGTVVLPLKINGADSPIAASAPAVTATFNAGDLLTVLVDGKPATVQGKVLNNLKLETCVGGMGANGGGDTKTTASATTAPVRVSSGFGAGATTDVSSLPVTSGSSAQFAAVIVTLGSVLAAAGTYVARARSGFSI